MIILSINTTQAMDYFHIKRPINAENEETKIKASLQEIESQIENTANEIAMLKRAHEEKLAMLHNTHEQFLMEKSSLQERLVEIEKQNLYNYILRKLLDDERSSISELLINTQKKIAEIKFNLDKINRRLNEINAGLTLLSYNTELLKRFECHQLKNVFAEREILSEQRYRLNVELETILDAYRESTSLEGLLRYKI